MDFFDNQQANLLATRLEVRHLRDVLIFPQYFQLETVYACNSRCTMCSINWDNGKSAKLNVQLFDKFVDEVKEYSNWVKAICLQGAGEPTLDTQLPERVKRLKDAGIKKVYFSTNGQLLNQELTQKLINSGLDDLRISFDAITPEIYKKIRPNLNFETVMTNALNAIQLRDAINPKMVIRMRLVILDENKHEVPKWLAFWENKLSEHDLAEAVPSHTFGNQWKAESDESISQFADKPCLSLFSTMILDSDGIAGLCCADCNGKYNMGDFSRQTIKEIWNGEMFAKFREYHLTSQRNCIDMCRGCHIWDRTEKSILEHGTKEEIV